MSLAIGISHTCCTCRSQLIIGYTHNNSLTETVATSLTLCQKRGPAMTFVANQLGLSAFWYTTHPLEPTVLDHRLRNLEPRITPTGWDSKPQVHVLPNA